MRSIHRRIATLSPSIARSTHFLVSFSASPSSNVSTAIEALFRDPLGRPLGLMASGSFYRGRDSISIYASMVFVGNIDQSVDTLLKTSHLLSPFPEAMIDPAFFDRFHAYIPRWEVPKRSPHHFTNQFGLITDYLAEFMREMRKHNFADAID